MRHKTQMQVLRGKAIYWYSFLSMKPMPPMKRAPKMDMPMQNIVPEHHDTLYTYLPNTMKLPSSLRLMQSPEPTHWTTHDVRSPECAGSLPPISCSAGPSNPRCATDWSTCVQDQGHASGFHRFIVCVFVMQYSKNECFTHRRGVRSRPICSKPGC